MDQHTDMEKLYPHSPDVAERAVSDCGFSKGWGMHFKPIESRIIDVHGHIQFDSLDGAEGHISRHIELMESLNVRHCVVCSPVMIKPEDRGRPQGFSILCNSYISELQQYLELVKQSGKISLMLFLHYDNPNLTLLKQSIAEGICAIKLHNAPMIVEAARPERWLDDDWSAVFSEMERQGLPALWHVTQRLTDCPYVGGDRNTYWKDGWSKGALFTNEDLLKVFLKVVEKYPGIRFIGAHQLHIGWERLSALLSQYPNLYIDTSIGCTVNEGDVLYEEDSRTIRDFFIRHSDRILYGTDYFISDNSEGEFTDDEKLICMKNHIRFIRQLRLPDEALQKAFHLNAEKVLRVV